MRRLRQSIKQRKPFESLQQELPWYTALLIFVSSTLASYWWLILGSLGGGIYAFQRWRKTPKGRLTWDRFVLHVPIFGRLNLLVAVARFARTLSTLLSSGVALRKSQIPWRSGWPSGPRLG